MFRLISAVPLLIILAACGDAQTGGGADTATTPKVRGVSDTEIRLGSHSDLSGPLASWGVSTINGLRMRFEEANAAGGIHGRQIRFFVEDAHYQVPVAVKAANKLINVDKIFAMTGAMGTPMNIAIMPRQFKAGVPNLFPMTAAVQMYEPLHPMKFSYFVGYRDQMRAGMAYFVRQNSSLRKACIQAVASDYGEEVEQGFDRAIEENNLEVVYRGRHKGSETDFVGTVISIKNSGCEILALGPLMKDSILIYTALRDIGWKGLVYTNLVPYTLEVAAANNGAMAEFYSVNQMRMADFPPEVAAGSWVGKWYTRYKAQFGVEPNVQAQAGYAMGEMLAIALDAAGRELTVEKLLAALESIDNYQDPFGGASSSFSASKHQGGNSLNLHVVRDGKWAVVETGLSY